ncbi:MAG: DUF459 domain-containing protein, partial [Chloroflexota bacterium]
PAQRVSPTTSLWRVLLTLAVGLLVAALLSARGIVHAGQGMSDGTERTVTLDAGQALLNAGSAVHLTWVWEQIAAARGFHTQPAMAPLLATRVAGQSNKRSTAWHFRRPPVVPAVANARPPARQAVHRLRAITPANPLRLLVTGDSLSGYLAPELVNEMSRVGPVHGFTDTHNGTGLTRPDFVDWSVVAAQQVHDDNPDAIVVLIGGNDFQNMTLPGHSVFIAGTPAWTHEYQRRAEICMRVWSQGGTRHVYWLSMPPAQNSAWAFDDAHINLALKRAAAEVPGARYLNVLGPITNHGAYSDFVNVNGQPTLIRESDGVHLNLAGSTIVAHEVVPVLKRQWHLHWPVKHIHRPGRKRR